jgi:hypothetical protein
MCERRCEKRNSCVFIEVAFTLEKSREGGKYKISPEISVSLANKPFEGKEGNFPYK